MNLLFVERTSSYRFLSEAISVSICSKLFVDNSKSFLFSLPLFPWKSFCLGLLSFDLFLCWKRLLAFPNILKTCACSKWTTLTLEAVNRKEFRCKGDNSKRQRVRIQLGLIVELVKKQQQQNSLKKLQLNSKRRSKCQQSFC